jgi:predicted dehydrogenase
MWGQVIGREAGITVSGVVDVNPATVAAFAAEHPAVPVFTELEEIGRAHV